MMLSRMKRRTTTKKRRKQDGHQQYGTLPSARRVVSGWREHLIIMRQRTLPLEAASPSSPPPALTTMTRTETTERQATGVFTFVLVHLVIVEDVAVGAARPGMLMRVMEKTIHAEIFVLFLLLQDP